MANEIVENAPLSVFVTGATSAAGRETVRRLKAAGHRVTGTTTGYENAALVRADGGLPAYPDLLRSGEIRSILQAIKADVVINLAPQIANYPPQLKADWNPRLLDDGVKALIEAAQAAEVKFIVHTSYAFADEESEPLADLLHAAQAGEKAILNGAIAGCVLRYGFIYGADVPGLSALRDSLQLARPVEGGAADSHAAWISAPDAARAAILAMEQRPAGLLVNVVEDELASPAAFMAYFAESQGFSAPGRAPRFSAWTSGAKTQDAVMRLSPRVSNAEAREKLGWTPRFANYRDGIDDLLLSWRAATEVTA